MAKARSRSWAKSATRSPENVAVLSGRWSGRWVGRWSGPLLVAAISLAVWLGGMFLVFESARLPDAASGKVLAVFGAGVSQETGLTAIVAAGGAPVRSVLGGFAWVAHSEAAGFTGRLKQNGALAAYGEVALMAGPMLAGCFAWVRVSVVPPPRITP